MESIHVHGPFLTGNTEQPIAAWMVVNSATPRSPGTVNQRFKCLLAGGAPTNNFLWLSNGSEVMVMNNGPNAGRRSISVVIAYMDG